ncbi:uncharacterized protein LOC134723621 [Mytilus trossulus]|uniref:uncharacterized protein LOC134723621 n=1 Tax=Mytilus trossulus TaxID=6551 RepID=UPI003003A88E
MMTMMHLFTCFLFVLMFGTSEQCEASFTATLPGGYNTNNLKPCVQYNQVLCPDDGYNSTTGVFTAEINGTYIVSVTMMTGLVAGHTNLMKNDGTYVWLYTGNQWDMATQVVCMDLVEGDRIWVIMANTASYTLFDVYNVFSAGLVSSD